MIRALALTAMLAACAPTPETASAPSAPRGAAQPLVQPPIPGPNGEEPRAAECDISVSFGSFGPGVDGPLKARVLELVEADAGVAAKEDSRWGREGESTLCIHTRDAAATDRLYTAIAGLLPTVSPRAPTTVTHHDGRSRSSGEAANKS